MCYRFFLKKADLDRAAELLRAALRATWDTQYNIPPGAPIPAVRVSTPDGPREIALLRWGFVPAWSRQPELKANPLANARVETITEKATFRAAARRRRCVIPASGFFEWETTPDGNKQPWLFEPSTSEPLLFAGLWEHWQGPGQEALESCTILTTQPNPLLARIHNRMPVLLDEETAEAWLQPAKELESLLSNLGPAPEHVLRERKVAPYVNSIRNQGPRCTATWSEPSSQGLLF